MIYTKTNATHAIFKISMFRNLSSAQLEPNSIYWYDQHDWSTRNTPFNAFIDSQHWEHLRSDITSKIFMFYGDEYFNMNDINDWCRTLKFNNINPSRVYLIVMDDNWAKWAKEKLEKQGIFGVNIQPLNILMYRVRGQTNEPLITHRFSSLSRNFGKWRLNVYAEFCNRDLLKDFNYTFSNIRPYGDIYVTEHHRLKKMLSDMGYDTSLEKFESWIAGIPYQLTEQPILEKLAKGTYDLIKSAGIHFLIESHFDPFWTSTGQRGTITPWDFSPAFPTEKTYKAIACFRPFIAFSTPRFLKEFRELGYETFHPFINESYDEIEKDSDRLMAIADEVERISKLSNEEFDSLIKNCEPIARKNFEIFSKQKLEMCLADNFVWLQEYFETANRPGAIKLS